MVLPSEVLQQFGPTAAYSFKATTPSTAGSSSVTMQLDSEDEGGFPCQAMIHHIYSTYARSGLSGTGGDTQLMVAVCAEMLAISGGNH
jgi:hypothetical protein